MRSSNPAFQHNVVDDYRSLLLEKRSEMLPKRPVKFDTLAEVGQVADEDQAVLLHDEFVAIRLSNLERELVQQIDAALSRMDSGEFGICMECDGPISAKRLQAIPWANCCIRCAEHQGSGRSHPAGWNGKAA